jgi:hypothetical protein
MFYYDPEYDPGTVYAISFSLPKYKSGQTKPGIIDYRLTRFDASQLTETAQRAFVESQGFQWAPEKFRIRDPNVDLDKAMYPHLEEAMSTVQQLHSYYSQLSLYHDLDQMVTAQWEYENREYLSVKHTLDVFTGAFMMNQNGGAEETGGASEEAGTVSTGFRVLQPVMVH